MSKILAWSLGLLALLGAGAYAASRVSPWPGALLIRTVFDLGGVWVDRKLERHVPQGVTSQLDLHYDPGDAQAFLDVYRPPGIRGSDRLLPAVVWVHGGGWVAGSKGQIANYARILAAEGYTVVGVGYATAPGSIHPTPVRQVNTALAYLARNAAALNIDPARFVLAGDSAGAHIAAQLANVISEPGYAKALAIEPTIGREQLAGLILYCGPFDFREADPGGPGAFLSTILWSYSGTRTFAQDPRFAAASLIEHVAASFPPVFISVGNDDPLEPHSHAFAGRLSALGVPVDRLFFPQDHVPELPHEYQFDLDSDAGLLALRRSAAFLAARTGAGEAPSPGH